VFHQAVRKEDSVEFSVNPTVCVRREMKEAQEQPDVIELKNFALQSWIAMG
jgi:hypothetical protein